MCTETDVKMWHPSFVFLLNPSLLEKVKKKMFSCTIYFSSMYSISCGVFILVELYFFTCPTVLVLLVLGYCMVWCLFLFVRNIFWLQISCSQRRECGLLLLSFYSSLFFGSCIRSSCSFPSPTATFRGCIFLFILRLYFFCVWRKTEVTLLIGFSRVLTYSKRK